MRRSARSVLRHHSLALLGVTVAAGLTTAAVSPSPALSAASTCPPAAAVRSVDPGEAVHGLTVSRGTTPDEFTGQVVGTIPGGIAPGLDMILVELEGSVITHPDGTVDRGIWSGMSGSPVYDDRDRLIGAVSYGLAFSPSNIAGVTPARAMYDLGRYEGSRLRGARTVVATPRAARQLRAAGAAEASGRQARLRLTRLPMPMSVSGLPEHRLERVAGRTGSSSLPLAAGATARVGGQESPIVAGGNIAMAMAYGDVTAAGVGTTTAVCGRSVLAFGHPFGFTGGTTASLHGAKATHVQHDQTFGSFKVATPTAPVGRFTQDRLAGILGHLGRPPRATPVTSTVTSSEGNRRTGTTHVTSPSWTSDVATIHLMSNLDRVYDGYRRGTGTMSWAITVRRPDGRLATLRRRDVYSSQRDLTFAMPWDFYQQIRAVTSNPFERVRVVSVEQRAHLDTRFRQRRIAKVQVRRHGRWATLRDDSVVRARAGRVLRVRAWLQPAAGSNVAPQKARYRVRVPRAAKGRFGVLSLRGGMNGSGGAKSARSFTDLLGRLARAPKNTDVVAELRVRTRRGTHRVQRTVAKPAPVAGHRAFGVAIR